MNFATLNAAEALSVALPPAIPDEIQWMPPGEHTITALDSQRQPVTRTVRVTPATAERLIASLASAKDRAASGLDDLPYVDFNHDDGEAAGHIIALRWGGDDPVTGGIRAKVRWTEPGIRALTGRAYRRFSPSFSVDADGEVVGAPTNMGGLVNRAAFKAITPIWSRSATTDVGGQAAQPKDNIMSDPNKELADLRAANAQLTTQLTELNAKLAAADQVETIRAKDSEISALKSTVESLNAKLADQAKANATAIVDAAVKAGKLAPQATDLHAKWVDALTANPGLAETLNAMSPNPALTGQVTGGANASQATGKTDAELFAELFRGEVSAGKSKHEALDIVRAKRPELHVAWLKAGGGQL